MPAKHLLTPKDRAAWKIWVASILQLGTFFLTMPSEGSWLHQTDHPAELQHLELVTQLHNRYQPGVWQCFHTMPFKNILKLDRPVPWPLGQGKIANSPQLLFSYAFALSQKVSFQYYFYPIHGWQNYIGRYIKIIELLETAKEQMLSCPILYHTPHSWRTVCQD